MPATCTTYIPYIYIYTVYIQRIWYEFVLIRSASRPQAALPRPVLSRVDSEIHFQLLGIAWRTKFIGRAKMCTNADHRSIKISKGVSQSAIYIYLPNFTRECLVNVLWWGGGSKKWLLSQVIISQPGGSVWKKGPRGPARREGTCDAWWPGEAMALPEKRVPLSHKNV